MSGSIKGEDPSTVDVEHPCGGSAVVERPAIATVKSAVKAEDVLPLLTRALHRVNEIKNIYASRLLSESVVRELRRTSFISISDLNPDLGTATEVRNKVDDILRRMLEELMRQTINVDHVRRNERYWAGYQPREPAFRVVTYESEVSQLKWSVLMQVACSLKQITTSRGIRLDASAIQRMREIQYVSPQSQYLSDMRAFVVFNQLRRFILKSRVFFNVIRKASLL
ncbi:hypothetical protein LSAT2_029414 [Lamellibrachia satsuma]|nr:hypothetical protein LSAT2_029414 [Lamellibrachia satsuma]